jgi:DNA-binding transcriptional ArsR family regulator
MIELREARPIARMLAGLSEPTRLMIALCLLERPHYVGELSEILKMPMVNVSHHLGVLKLAGLVEDTREGRRVLYRLRADVLDATSEPDTQVVLNLGPYRLWITNPPPVRPVNWQPGRKRGRPKRQKRSP